VAFSQKKVEEVGLFFKPQLFKYRLYYLSSRTNSHHHTHTLMRKLDLHQYEETCTWLRGIRFFQGFAHDRYVILTIVAHPRVSQLKLFREHIVLGGKSQFEHGSNMRPVASTPETHPRRRRLVRQRAGLQGRPKAM
jgi:hypothetical protein